jgi:hypothetical protein
MMLHMFLKFNLNVPWAKCGRMAVKSSDHSWHGEANAEKLKS